MHKRWKILSADPDTCKSLHDSLKINPVLCKILVQRGAATYEKAKNYFRPSMDMLYDPWMMKDMDKAVKRIMQAFTYNEKILVFGDYDVDGTSSVACMTKFLRDIYKPENIEFYIPHRYREGYGVSKAGIDYAYKENFSLIISLDCGIKSVSLIAYARNLGIDFIVCDHHLPDNELPPAVAILNPKQKDCGYPFKDLCGCGVGYKLICALSKTFGLAEDYPSKYLDLVATAIAADIVSMTDENRILVYYGLKKANSNPNPGIKALMHLSGIKTNMIIGNLVFMIAPRVNAAGRMDDAKKAVQMFISDNYHQALQYAEMLHSDNDDRREADKLITEEALKLINDNESWITRKSTVVYQSHWHKGVVGIVASRLIDHYYRPTIVLTQSGEYVAGSARSVAGFNVYEAIHQCKELLLGYGGHFYAAGMTMSTENVVPFQNMFEQVVSSIITDEMLVPEILIDAEVKLKDLTPSFYNILSQMEPFGPDNVKPVFVVSNVMDTGFSKVVKDHHIKLEVTQDNIVFSGIGFNLANKFDQLAGKQPVDIVFTLDENEWNGNKHLQMKVIDLKKSEL